MAFDEKHYTCAELAEMWHVCENTVRGWFVEEPGVLKFGRPERRYKRQRISLRIPASVAERVYLRKRKLDNR